MPSTLAVMLPLPPIEASLNFKPATRGGRMAQNEAVQAYKEACAVLIRAAWRKSGAALPEPLALHYFWFLGRRRLNDGRALKDGLCRPKDLDNAEGAAKPIQDALQIAGLLPKGDAAKRVRVAGTVLYGRATDHGGQMGIMLVVTSDAEAAS